MMLAESPSLIATQSVSFSPRYSYGFDPLFVAEPMGCGDRNFSNSSRMATLRLGDLSERRVWKASAS